MNSVINLDLLSNPLNWLTVVIVVTFGLVLIALISPQQS